MATFKDNSQRDWTIYLDAPGIVAVREVADPEFMRGDPVDTIERLREDPLSLCETIRALCKDQIDERKMTEKEFYRGVIGDAISDAADALVKAIVNFTPSHTRKMLETCAAKNEAARNVAMERAIKAIEDPNLMIQFEKALDKEIEDQIERALTRLSSATK